MAVWRLQVNTGGTNVADYCLKNHVAAMGWGLRELTPAEKRSMFYAVAEEGEIWKTGR